jgi:flagellar hook-length control protein FliK
LQKVASETPVSRPLRPEPSQARQTGVRKDAFESLLDTQPTEASPRPERSDRPERRRATDRGSETRRSDDRPRVDSRRSREANDRAASPADRNQSKPTASDSTRQAKDGQAPSSMEAATDTPPEEATTQEFLVLAEGAVVVAEGEAETADTEEAEVAASETAEVAEGSDEVTGDVQAQAETKTADVATLVATALPSVTQAETAPVTVDAEAEIALAAAGDDAPAAPADDVAPELDADADAAPQKAAPEAPKQADAAPKTTPTEDGKKPAEVLATNPTEKPQQKADATVAEPKAEKTETKTAAEASAHQTAKPVAHEDAGRPRGDGIEPKEPKTPAATQHAKAAEHAPAAPTTQAEVRNENSPAFASQTSAATNTINNVAAVPLHITANAALPTLSSLAALRVDTPAEKGVPINGLAVEIVARATEGSKRFEIRLDPPELGRIDVRLDVDQSGKVTSRLVVERAETLDLLRRDAHQLERALASAGLDTGGGMEFSLRDQNSANRDQQQREGGNRSHLIVPEDETIAAEAARRGYGRMIGLGGGVDIRI